MIQEHVLGRIVDMTEDGEAVIKAALPSLTRAADRQYETVEIILPDGRKITPRQRKMVYSLIGAIAEYIDGIKNAETIESTKNVMKWEFLLSRMEGQERRLFLSAMLMRQRPVSSSHIFWTSLCQMTFRFRSHRLRIAKM